MCTDVKHWLNNLIPSMSNSIDCDVNMRPSLTVWKQLPRLTANRLPDLFQQFSTCQSRRSIITCLFCQSAMIEQEFLIQLLNPYRVSRRLESMECPGHIMAVDVK